MKGLFTDDGLAGMLEAADMQKIYIQSPFLVALLDRVCRESDECPFTTVLTDYVNLMKQVCDHKDGKIDNVRYFSTSPRYTRTEFEWSSCAGSLSEVGYRKCEMSNDRSCC